MDSRVKKASTAGLVGNLYVLPGDVVDDFMAYSVLLPSMIFSTGVRFVVDPCESIIIGLTHPSHILRSCPGWKFAMIELQAFVVELVGSFEFELTPEARNVIPAPSTGGTPILENHLEKGTQLPLRLRIASRGEEL